MSTASGGSPRQTRSLGVFEGALLRPFVKLVTVRAARPCGERFRLVTLTGESVRDLPWTPGAKVQVQLGGWVYRTYTPISWNPNEGSLDLLLYAHGDGPGASWTRSLSIGDTCAIFGPRGSIDLDATHRPLVIFGDETSFGLVHALRFSAGGANDVAVVLEVTSPTDALAVLTELGIENVELVERSPGDGHLRDLEAAVVGRLAARPVQSCILTGKATSIQALNKVVRNHGLGSRHIRAKAYWAPGKTGLD